MEKQKYLLSIVIPTKDRYQYLVECIKTLINIDSDEIEIVIQDNTIENSSFIKELKEWNWPHIKYYHNKEHLSVVQNSEFAVENSSGKYVCFIGDDDSVSEIVIDVVRMMSVNKIESCNVDMAGYYWPDVPNRTSRLLFNKDEPKIRMLDTKKILNKYLKKGMQEIIMLPRLYHGIISRSILEKIKMRSGSFFPGPSPDMANAIVAALVLDTHLYIKFPIIISGTSFKSTAGMSIRKQHKGSVKNIRHLPKGTDERWSSKIPKVWLMNTIWPETCLKALEAASESELAEKLNYYPMYFRILIKYSDYRKLVTQQLKSTADYFFLFIYGISDLANWMFKNAIKKFKKVLSKDYSTGEKISLTKACKIVNENNKNIKAVEIMRRKLKSIL